MIKAAVLGLFLMMGVLVGVIASRGQSRNPASTLDVPTLAEEESAPPVRPPTLALQREKRERHASTMEESPPAEREEVPAPKARTQEDVIRDLQNAFRTDQPANEASAKTTAAIVAGFSSPKAEGAHLGSVDCRATRCRFEVDFADKETDKRVLLDIWDLLGSAGAEVSDLAFYVESREQWPDGRINTKIHLYPAERKPIAQLAGS